MPVAGAIDFDLLGTDCTRVPTTRQPPRDYSPPPRPPKVPRYDPEVRQVSPPPHVILHRRRARSPTPTVLNLPNTPEPVPVPPFDDAEEDYVLVEFPRLGPPARRYSTSVIANHPVSRSGSPISAARGSRLVSPVMLSSINSRASSPARPSKSSLSRPALLTPISPSPLSAESTRTAELSDGSSERPDCECLTSTLQARFRSPSSSSLACSYKPSSSYTGSVFARQRKLVKPRRPCQSIDGPRPPSRPRASTFSHAAT